MTTMTFTDFLGNEVTVGDYIFYSTTGRYAESRIGKVSRFTPKTMFITIVKHNRPGEFNYGTEHAVKNDFVKVKCVSDAPTT